MSVHAEPSPGQVSPAPARERWATRFRGLGSRERWGYAVWSAVALIVAIPEIWTLAGNPPWPSISAVVGHLENLWPPVAAIIVALIAGVAFQVAGYRRYFAGGGKGRAAHRRALSPSGRLAATPDGISVVSVPAYFTAAVAVIITGSLLAATLSTSAWITGYVMYGLIAAFCVAIPNILAFWFRKDVPFPTLFRTVADLERRWHPAALVIVAALAVLLIHLAFYPWPGTLAHATTRSP